MRGRLFPLEQPAVSKSHHPEGDDGGALHAHDLHAVTKSFEQFRVSVRLRRRSAEW